MPKKTFNIADALAMLGDYAENFLGLQPMDRIYAENQLCELFGVVEPKRVSGALPDLQKGILDPIIKYALANKLCTPDTALHFETKIMGYVTPAPGLVIAAFDNIAAYEGASAACEYLNKLSVRSNYIRLADISKNIKWTAPGEMGDLTITINLSKPEKDNKQVRLQRAEPQSGYPKCPLCIENVGYAGSPHQSPRQTLRTIPIVLGGEEWHFQFSPFVYYDNHCIALAKEHRPMLIDDQTFTRLIDFIELFPDYFIGSNADLPIVGGSILSHDHFQGGKKVLPIFSRGARQTCSHPDYPDVTIEILDWYNSVIKLTASERDDLEELAGDILSAWQDYSDPASEILAFSGGERHNTITPVAAANSNGTISLYIILRNNRTDEKRPDGIFHPTEDMHNIKKEGIGIIEAMGIFILPGRLFAETRDMVSILTGETPLNFAEISKEKHPLFKHLPMIAQLTNDHGTAMADSDAESAVVNYINKTAVKILNCTAVFKNTHEGQESFLRFLSSVGIQQVK